MLGTAGGDLLLRRVTQRQEAALEERVAAVRARLRDADALLRREASLLAAEPAGAAAVARGDAGAVAAGADRLRALAQETLGDVVVLVSAAGERLAQVPATPPVDVRALPAAGPTAVLVLLDGRPHLVGVAAVGDGDGPAARVAVAARLDRLVDPAAGAAVVFAAGDRLRAATLPGAPPAGWAAVGPAASLTVAGAPWALRAVGRLGDDVVWAAVPEGAALGERRRLVVVLVAAFVAAAG
ncbi:MAG TPA: hypothetical protein VFX28_10945, partial [Methylomirabilota bacterium]|nr:hypothetical protein [Methylomirabilota bacterium]